MTQDQDSTSPFPSPGLGRVPEGGERSLNWFSRNQKLIWLSLIGAAVAVAAVLTYVLFFRSQRPPVAYEGDVKLTIAMPQQTPAGSEISITVGLQNQSNSKLTGMILEMFYPQDFRLARGERSYNLPDLDKGGRKEIVIVGVLSGNIQELKTVSVKLRYIPENFRSTFLAEASATTEVRAANLAVSLLAPTRVIAGQAVLFRLTVENVSAEAFAGLTAKFDFPEGFALQAGSGPNGVEIGGLNPGQKKTIEAGGVLSAPAGTEVLTQAEIRQGDLVLARSFAFTQVDPSPLAVSHEAICSPLIYQPINLPVRQAGGQATCSSLEIPSEIEYKVRYQNQSQVALKNAVVTVFFDGVFSGAEITAEKGVLRDRQVSFLPAGNPELRAVAPGQKGEFTIRVRIPETFLSALGGQKNPILSTRVEYKADEVPRPIAGNSLSYPVKTKLTLAAKATRLPDGQASGGDGTYLVELTLTNTVNDLTGGELAAFVPAGAAADFSESAEWNESSGLVRWRFGAVFAFTGTFHEPRKLTFRVSGAGPDILRDLAAAGRDEFADADVESNRIEAVSGR